MDQFLKKMISELSTQKEAVDADIASEKSKGKRCNMTVIEDLEEKCYAIRGRNGSVAKFSYEPKAPKLPVEKNNVTPEPYGGVFTEFGITSGSQHN